MTRREVEAHIAGFPVGAARSRDLGALTTRWPWVGSHSPRETATPSQLSFSQRLLGS